MRKALLGVAFTGGMFSLSMRFLSGTFFVRAISGLPKILERRVIIHVGEPPAAAAASFTNAVREVMLFHYLRLREAWDSNVGRDPKRKRRVDKKKIVADWNTHCRVWNGYWNIQRDDNIEVGVPRPVDRAKHLGVMARTYARTMLRGRMCVPVHNKWTKLQPSNDFIFASISCCEMLPHLLSDEVKGNISVQTAPGLDHALQETINWHAVAGTRLNASRVFVNDPKTKFLSIFTCIVLETCRSLTAYFLWCSRAKGSHCVDDMLNYMHDSFSPIVVGLQHLSSLLRGTSARLAILYQAYGMNSYEEFRLNFPEFALLFTSGCRLVSAAIFRRFQHPRETNPFTFVRGAGGRRSRQERLEIYRPIVGQRACCKGPSLDALLGNVRCADELLTPDWERVTQSHAEVLGRCLSVADVERKHKRTDTLVTTTNKEWSTVCAAIVNREASELSLAAAALEVDAASVFKIAPPAPPDTVQAIQKPKRARSAFEFYKKDRVAEDKMDLGPMNVLSWNSEYKQGLRNDFEHAVPE